MKKFFIITLFLTFIALSAQTITADNYFQYLSNGKNVKGRLTTAWLNKFEVAKILEEEMKNSGFKWISTFYIIQISDNVFVNSICFSEKSKVGFLYEPVHNAPPSVEERSYKSLYKNMTGNDYCEKIVKLDGESEFMKIKEVPDNFFIIKENSYWYQYTEQPQDVTLVTKEIITEILRHDIRIALQGFNK